MNTQRHQELLDESLAGKSDAFGLLLEYYRPYLIVLAKRYLDPRVRGRVDESDIVQVTFLEAQRDFKSFRGSQIEELLAWLRHILRNNVSTAHHNHLHAQKRAAGREVNNQADSGLALTDLTPAETSSPSQRLMKDEASAYLASCLQELPDTQQEALRLRYIEGCSLKEIALQMNKTEMAAAGLLKRGLQALRDRMVTDSSSQGYPT